MRSISNWGTCSRCVSFTHAHEPALVGQHNELGTVPQFQLVQDSIEMGLDRRLGQDEVLRDLGVAHRASHQGDDLLLPISQCTDGADVG